MSDTQQNPAPQQPIITEEDYKRRLLRIWLFGFVALLLVMGSQGWYRFYRLYREGVATQVTIKEVDTDRKLLRYDYTVSGTAYSGEGADGNGNPAIELIHSGDRLQGYYLPSDASLSCLGDPAPQLTRETVKVLLVALLLPSLIVYRGWRRFKRWNAAGQLP